MYKLIVSAERLHHIGGIGTIVALESVPLNIYSANRAYADVFSTGFG